MKFNLFYTKKIKIFLEGYNKMKDFKLCYKFQRQLDYNFETGRKFPFSMRNAQGLRFAKGLGFTGKIATV